MIRELLSTTMREYPKARNDDLSDHPVAKLVRYELPAAFRSAITDHHQFVVDGSSGNGSWADAPWIAVFDPIVTVSAQEGYYPVYLFNYDLSRVVLSLNQGVTALKRELGVGVARDQLKARASLIRGRLKGKIDKRFSTEPIQLGARKPGSNLELYEAGHSLGVAYDRESLPNDAILAADLASMLNLYTQLTLAGGVDEFSAMEVGDPNQSSEKLEEARRYRYHRRLERNRQLAEKAREIHGCVCQVCAFDFGSAYGTLGAGYIEAHHRVPLSELAKQGQVSLSPKDDFAVVCANCHRMLHRKGAPETFSDFVSWFRSLTSGSSTSHKVSNGA